MLDDHSRQAYARLEVAHNHLLWQIENAGRAPWNRFRTISMQNKAARRKVALEKTPPVLCREDAFCVRGTRKCRYSIRNSTSQIWSPESLLLRIQNERLAEEARKEAQRAKQAALDKASKAFNEILGLVGLQNVKDHMIGLQTKIDTFDRLDLWGEKVKEKRFGTVLLGNTGVGKTTVARAYANYLVSSGLVKVKERDRYDTMSEPFDEFSGTYLSDIGVSSMKPLIDSRAYTGGVMIIDEAHRLTDSSCNGSNVLNYLLEQVDAQRGKIIFVFAGTIKGTQGILGAGNGNAASLLPYVLKLNDLEDDHLLVLLQECFAREFNGKQEVQGEKDGLYMRVAARRLGRKRGGISFGNARDVERLFAQICDRQSTRRKNLRVDKDYKPWIPVEGDTQDPDCFFTKEDILGPSPTDAVLESSAWKKLQRLTGLGEVKEALLGVLEISKTNYERELQEKEPLKLSFNRLFLGPPGTGKTVVAKIYGQILADIGILSKGELIIKNPSDLIGKYIGESEAYTKAALSAAAGSVLVIDEAYMLHPNNKDGDISSDCYRQAVLDTLVAEVQNVPGEDRCVLLLGYVDEMEYMIRNGNPGLARRFPLEHAFVFQNFTLEELESILRTKLEDNDLEATDDAIKVAMNVLDKARSRLNFGNGGDVENLVTKAKVNYQIRASAIPSALRPQDWVLEPQDFDPEYDRGKSAMPNLRKLFEDVVGCETVVKKLEGYQRVCQSMKLKNLDPKDWIPTNFVFKGPPGTGKTTTARKIAQVYYDMGFLSEPSVVECSASDLVGKWVGHSGPKTVKALESGLGKVLFIDEAYRLASSGGSQHDYHAEVISELVDCLTKPKFYGKIVIILAGYEHEINNLLSTNPGLASRFPEEIIFPSLAPVHCLQVLKMKLHAVGISLDVTENSAEHRNMLRLFGLLINTPNWGNARDVESLSKGLCRTVFLTIASAESELVCTAGMAIMALEMMLGERMARGGMAGDLSVAKLVSMRVFE